MKDLSKEKEQLVRKDKNHKDMIFSQPSEENASQRGSDQLCQKLLTVHVK